MKITADTITDEQIRDLQDDLCLEYRSAARQVDRVAALLADCAAALQGHFGDARARCAEILNARRSK